MKIFCLFVIATLTADYLLAAMNMHHPLSHKILFMYVQKIFLADDDQEDVQFFRDAVNDINSAIEVTHGANGRELMECLEDCTTDCDTDVIFLDLNMPKMNGFECLTSLKNHADLKLLPVVILSTSSDPRNIKLLYDMGAHHYLVKPFSYSELRNVLTKVLSIDLRSTAPRCEFEDFLVY